MTYRYWPVVMYSTNFLKVQARGLLEQLQISHNENIKWMRDDWILIFFVNSLFIQQYRICRWNSTRRSEICFSRRRIHRTFQNYKSYEKFFRNCDTYCGTQRVNCMIVRKICIAQALPPHALLWGEVVHRDGDLRCHDPKTGTTKAPRQHCRVHPRRHRAKKIKNQWIMIFKTTT